MGNSTTTYPDKFNLAYRFTFGEEKGTSNDPRDKGGFTVNGLSDMADGKKDGKFFGLDLKTATPEQQKDAYFKTYWTPAGCDAYPAAIALMVFDSEVNSGAPDGRKFLQVALKVTPDGLIGPKTLAALNAVWMAGDAAKCALIDAFTAARLAHMKGTASWETYKNGWSARLDMMKKTAKTMISLS